MLNLSIILKRCLVFKQAVIINECYFNRHAYLGAAKIVLPFTNTVFFFKLKIFQKTGKQYAPKLIYQKILACGTTTFKKQ